jgi:hypothetical protein
VHRRMQQNTRRLRSSERPIKIRSESGCQANNPRRASQSGRFTNRPLRHFGTGASVRRGSADPATTDMTGRVLQRHRPAFANASPERAARSGESSTRVPFAAAHP